jgi:hypothetical protein
MTTNLATAGSRATAAQLAALATDISTLTTGSIASSTTETVIGTAKVPANTVSLGDILKIRILGSVDATGTPTVTFKLRFTNTSGGTLLTMFSATARASTNEPYYVDLDLMVTATGASANFEAAGFFIDRIVAGTAATSGQVNNVNAGTFDSTVDTNLVLTATWGTSSASNIARTLQGKLSKT